MLRIVTFLLFCVAASAVTLPIPRKMGKLPRIPKIPFVGDAPPPPYPLSSQAHLGRGFNAISEEFMEPVYRFTYDDQSQWYDPFGGNWWTIPDEVYVNEIGTSDDVDIRAFHQHISEAYSYSLSSWGISAKASYKGVNLNLVLNRTHGHIDETMKNDTNSWVINSRTITLNEFCLYHHAKVSEDFLADVDDLPTSLNTTGNKLVYRKFLDIYGTHVITRSRVGGLINFTLVESHSSDWVTWNINLAISYMEYQMGVGGGGNKNHTHEDHDFDLHSKETWHSDGGDPTVLKASGYKEWVNTIAHIPGWLHLQKPAWSFIFELVPDANKANLLSQVVVQYLTGKIK